MEYATYTLKMEAAGSCETLVSIQQALQLAVLPSSGVGSVDVTPVTDLLGMWNAVACRSADIELTV